MVSNRDKFKINSLNLNCWISILKKRVNFISMNFCSSQKFLVSWHSRHRCWLPQVFRQHRFKEEWIGRNLSINLRSRWKNQKWRNINLIMVMCRQKNVARFKITIWSKTREQNLGSVLAVQMFILYLWVVWDPTRNKTQIKL